MDSESNKYENLEGMLQDGISEPLNLPLQYLRSITNNFSDERLLGEGGFGMVYKGVLRNGETVAVKKLNSSMPGIKDRHFDNEAKHLMKLKHPNVVLLVGWCSETENIYTQYNGKYICAEKSERLLCLEYMPNGNLRKYLSDEASGLGWDIRYRIIKGICHGLHYLHVECQHNAPIIHMDLKPANILLDNNMVPKIADFGLSRLFSKTKTWTQTMSRDGTLGYMAPEYINKGLISTKSDIFSLGVIIIEIVTGHRDYPDGTGISSEEYIELVVKNWRNRLRNSHCYTTQEIDCQQIRECIEIGLVCVTLDRSKRPTTRQIIKMLHGRTNFTYWKEIQTSSLLPVQQTHNLNGGLNPLYENPILKLMQPQSQQSPQQGYGQNTGNSGFLQSQLQQKKQEEPPPQQQHTQQVLQQQSHQEMQQHLSSSCYDISNVASSMSRSGSASQLQSSLLPGSSVYQQSIFEGNDGGPGLLLHHSLHNFSSQEASNLLNLSLGSQLMASEGWPSKRLAVESLSSLELQSMQQPKLKKVNHQSNVSHISGTLPPLSSRDGSGGQACGTNDQGHLLSLSLPFAGHDGMTTVKSVGVASSGTDTITIASFRYSDVNLLPENSIAGCLGESGTFNSLDDVCGVKTFVKVCKSGSITRSLDITRFRSYFELRDELERLFGLEGQLGDPLRSGWQLVFIDQEDDVRLVGDDPWEEFVNSVWSIKISPQDVQQMALIGL